MRLWTFVSIELDIIRDADLPALDVSPQHVWTTREGAMEAVLAEIREGGSSTEDLQWEPLTDYVPGAMRLTGKSWDHCDQDVVVVPLELQLEVHEGAALMYGPDAAGALREMAANIQYEKLDVSSFEHMARPSEKMTIHTWEGPRWQD